MLKLAGLVVVGAATAVAGSNAQTLKDPKPKTEPLRVLVAGTRLSGERELGAAVAGKTDAEKVAMLKAAMRPVRLGEPVQLTVQLARPGEPVRTVTADPRTKYMPNMCLIVTKFGLVTIDQTMPECVPGVVTDVQIVMDDALDTKASNRVYFEIIK